MANLSTESDYVEAQLIPDTTQAFIHNLVQSINKRTIGNNEEYILNAISCITNILFYDVPSTQLLSTEVRIETFNSIQLYILATQNEEIQIEAGRVLSNLSRHQALCLEFVRDSTFMEALTVVLDLTLRDLVFYSVGIIINITLHDQSRQILLEKGQVIPKLVDVLKDSNIEDIDMSKVAAKALLNLTKGQNSSRFWPHEATTKLASVLDNLAEEVDSIIVSSSFN